jgi:tRNA dimethylallyltransferase
MRENPFIEVALKSPAPLLLAGPTASGKSGVALYLAELLDGEIISVDSMQVYRGMDIGTAKPSPAEQERIPHHLIDLAELTDPFDAAQFAHRALETIRALQARLKTPILCGGTGLYFKALIKGVGFAPPADQSVRAELENLPLTKLLEELERRDPVLFSRIDRQNRRRLTRALEVIRLTGRPFSAQQSDWTRSPPVPLRFYGLKRAPEDLRERINSRVDQMFIQGLVEETQHLIEKGLLQNRAAMQALGYRQVVEFLQGKGSLPETRDLIKIRTWQFARRQMTWFRRETNLSWIELSKTDSLEVVAQRIARHFLDPEKQKFP